MCTFSANFAFDKATNGQTDIRVVLCLVCLSVRRFVEGCQLCRKFALFCLVHIFFKAFICVTSCVFQWRDVMRRIDDGLGIDLATGRALNINHPQNGPLRVGTQLMFLDPMNFVSTLEPFQQTMADQFISDIFLKGFGARARKTGILCGDIKNTPVRAFNTLECSRRLPFGTGW